MSTATIDFDNQTITPEPIKFSNQVELMVILEHLQSMRDDQELKRLEISESEEST